MARITVNGFTFDTEDIDLLVNYCPIATLYGAVKAGDSILAEMKPDDPFGTWYEHRIETHRLALDIAERNFLDGVKEVKGVIRKQQAQYNLGQEIESEARREIATKRNAPYKGIEY